MSLLARADIVAVLVLLTTCIVVTTTAGASPSEPAAAADVKPLPTLAVVPVDIGVRKAIPAHEEAVTVKSSFDYEREAEERAAATLRPPAPQTMAFTGGAAAMT